MKRQYLVYLSVAAVVIRVLVHGHPSVSSSVTQRTDAVQSSSTPGLAEPPGPYSDGAWQSAKVGSSPDGHCDLGAVMMFVTGSDWITCLDGLQCQPWELEPSHFRWTREGPESYSQIVSKGGQPFAKVTYATNVSHSAVTITQVKVIGEDPPLPSYLRPSHDIWADLVGGLMYKCNIPSSRLPRF